MLSRSLDIHLKGIVPLPHAPQSHDSHSQCAHPDNPAESAKDDRSLGGRAHAAAGAKAHKVVVDAVGERNEAREPEDHRHCLAPDFCPAVVEVREVQGNEELKGDYQPGPDTLVGG